MTDRPDQLSLFPQEGAPSPINFDVDGYTAAVAAAARSPKDPEESELARDYPGSLSPEEIRRRNINRCREIQAQLGRTVVEQDPPL
jgi:hypothetical protein